MKGPQEASQAKVAEASDRTRPSILFGLGILVVIFGGFGSWATMVELDSAAVASGTVEILGRRKVVQHLEGGIVEELRVRNGDRVEKGQVLLRINGVRARADLQILSGRHDAARAAVARLRSELNQDGKLVFPPDLVQRAQDSILLAETLEGQRAIFEMRRRAFESRLSVLHERIAQLEKEIEGLNAQDAARDRQIRLIAEELEGLRELFAKGFAPRTRILALEREQARLEGEKGENAAAAARLRGAIAETEMQIEQARREMLGEVAAELRQQQEESYDLAERVAAARFSYEMVDITAPVAGTVVGLQVFTEGGVIQPGQTLLEIVPDADRLVAEVRLRPLDIDDIQVGQSAVVTFPAFTSRIVPRLSGGVTYVSADVLVDEATGLPYYLARIEIVDDELARLGPEMDLHPGMPVEAMIQTGANTPLNYLVKPIAESIRHAWRER